MTECSLPYKVRAHMCKAICQSQGAVGGRSLKAKKSGIFYEETVELNGL